jgi:hypothetical protein
VKPSLPAFQIDSLTPQSAAGTDEALTEAARHLPAQSASCPAIRFPIAPPRLTLMHSHLVNWYAAAAKDEAITEDAPAPGDGALVSMTDAAEEENDEVTLLQRALELSMADAGGSDDTAMVDAGDNMDAELAAGEAPLGRGCFKVLEVWIWKLL